MTPDNAAAMISYVIGGPGVDELAGHVARIEADRRKLRYRLFASRWRREADRLLIERLKAKMEDAKQCPT